MQLLLVELPNRWRKRNLSFLVANVVENWDLSSCLGSGCGSVGRAVASNSRGKLFESSHRQKFILNVYCQLYWKDENKEKEAWNGLFKKDLSSWRFIGGQCYLSKIIIFGNMGLNVKWGSDRKSQSQLAFFAKWILYKIGHCGQPYKHATIVNNDNSVIL